MRCGFLRCFDRPCRKGSSEHLVYRSAPDARLMRTHTEGELRPSCPLNHSPVRAERVFCVLMSHLPRLIGSAGAADEWPLTWSCGDFQYPKVWNLGRESSEQNDSAHWTKQEANLLPWTSYLGWESTLQVRISAKEVLGDCFYCLAVKEGMNRRGTRGLSTSSRIHIYPPRQGSDVFLKT